MKFIDNFDLSYNVKFLIYVVFMIIGEICRYLCDNNLICVLRLFWDIVYKVFQVREWLISEISKELIVEDIVKVFEVLYEEIVFVFDVIQDLVFLFELIYNDGGDLIYVMD